MLSFPDEQKTYVSMWWQANDDVIKPMHFGDCHGRQTQDLPLVGFALCQKISFSSRASKRNCSAREESVLLLGVSQK